MPPPTIKPEDMERLSKAQNKNGVPRIVELMSSDAGKDRESEYLHWDKLRYKNLPEGVESHEEWWFLTKLRRVGAYRKLPLIAQNRPFIYWTPDRLLECLHKIDKQASGEIKSAEEVINSANSRAFMVSSLMEEAITSSQLEGASTTYKVAKDMLRDNRKPKDKSEQMIYNNYAAMLFIRESKNQELTPELIKELHRIVTYETLEHKKNEGKFREAEDNVMVLDKRDQKVLHTPPPAEELDERITRLCKFANTTNESGRFLHPVVKAIVLHFMIGYDHPFVDGNGRTARALFYWTMAKEKYWLIEYISISKIIKGSPGQYAKAYLYTESDDFDLTYFIDYNLKVILQAIEALFEYYKRKVNQVKHIEENINNSKLSKILNHRQLALISHAARNLGSIYSIKSHLNSHKIAYPTAREDLYELTDLGILKKVRKGRAFIFQARENLVEHLKNIKIS